MQVKFKTLYSSLFLAFLLVGCASGTFRWPKSNPFEMVKVPQSMDLVQKKENAFRLVFSSNVLGEVAPCGCAVGPKGGLDRRLNFIDMKARSEVEAWPYLVVDAGNALFPTLKLDPARRSEYTKVAEEILEAHAIMGIQVQNVGHLDMALGAAWLKDSARIAAMPLVSASWVQGEEASLVFTPSKTIQVGKQSVLVTGLSGGVQDGVLPGYSVREPKLALQAVLDQNKNHQGPIVVLSDLGIPRDKELAEDFKDVQLIIVGSRSLGGLSIPTHAGSSIIVQAEFRGQQWGQLDLFYQPQGKHWVYLERQSDFSKRWEILKARYDRDMENLKRGSDRRLEEQRHSRVAKDLMSYAPGSNESENVFYDFQMIDLTEKFQKRNKLTSKMNYLIDLKN